MRQGGPIPNLQLLSELSDGRFHSGQVLAERAGVSRTAIWKQLAALQAFGIEVEAIAGKGYRLQGGLELLSADRIRYALSKPSRALLAELNIHTQLDSTNAELLRVPRICGEGAIVCAAEQQTAGRGRRGRPWVSPFARNLYFSMAWEFAEGAAALGGLSLAVGVCIAEALQRCELPAPALKWPNDLLYNGRKCAGVLIEVSGDAAGPCRAVVGVGLNVRMPASSAQQIDQPWTDLCSVAGRAPVSRNAVLAALLDGLLPLLQGYAQEGFAPWRSRWCALDAHAGLPVVVTQANERISGLGRGVDQRGALLLETTTGVQSVYSGEVSLRARAQ